MRKNHNPNKDKKLDKSKFMHRIIIPVHISNNEYAQDLLKILKITLQSLYKSVHSKTAITIVNNGSNAEVVDFLNNEFKEKNIQELIHTESIGKLNAILKVLRLVDEEIITISDADVLFLNGWQNETTKVFNNFSKAGVVGIVPQFKQYTVNSFNLFFDNFFSKKLKFTQVVNPEGLKKFYKSIGWNDNYNKFFLKTNLTITSKNGEKAIVGSGHFVATYRKEVFDYLPKESSKYLLGGDSERKYLDEPVLKSGGWRLTTNDNYAYHLGNIYEDWMQDELDKSDNKPSQKLIEISSSHFKGRKFSYFIKNHLFRKIISPKSIFKKFLISKGLDKNIANGY
ncbi:MAG: glycosyltransferase family 2 protein [Flavobacteriaceae bacterium]|nr:glycosyltransferase family 2 protein [Flavobacteriaceae bacterium]